MASLSLRGQEEDAMPKTDTLEEVCKPIAQAHGLSNEHYINEGTFHEERDALLYAAELIIFKNLR